MANMSYCRFNNTLSDLFDCQGALEDFLDNDDADAISSDEERRKAKQLIDLCHDIAERYEPSDIDRKAEELADHDDEEDDDEE